VSKETEKKPSLNKVNKDHLHTVVKVFSGYEWGVAAQTA